MAIVVARDMYKCSPFSRKRATGYKKGKGGKKRVTHFAAAGRAGTGASFSRARFPVPAIARAADKLWHTGICICVCVIEKRGRARERAPRSGDKRRAMSYGTTTGLGRIWKTGNGRGARLPGCGGFLNRARISKGPVPDTGKETNKSSEVNLHGKCLS